MTSQFTQHPKFRVLCMHRSQPLFTVTLDHVQPTSHVPPRSHPDRVHQLRRCLSQPPDASVHPLASLFSANPAESAAIAETLIARRPLRPSSSSLSLYRRDLVSLNVPIYPSRSAVRCTRDAFAEAHRYAQAHIFALSLDSTTGTSTTTTGREVRFSPSARASRRRYDGDDACAPPPIHPFPSGHFRGAFEAATLLSRRTNTVSSIPATNLPAFSLSRAPGDFVLVKRASRKNRWMIEIVVSVFFLNCSLSNIS